MAVTNGRRVALLGLDSLTPAIAYRMLEQGVMPTLAKLAAGGWWSEVIPTMPPTTPAGWTTVATGAWPSTHGIEGFAVHRAGDPLDHKLHALTSNMVRAEPIWTVADRHGMSSVLLKFPITWPPSACHGVTQVDGAAGWGGLKCVHDLVHSGCWDSEARASAPTAGDVVAQEWMTRDNDNLGDESVQVLALQPPQWWTGLAADFDARFSANVRLVARQGGTVIIHLLGGLANTKPSLLVADRPHATGCRPLGEGEWSDWLRLDFGAGTGEGFVRFKLTRLAVDPPSLRLYQSQVHRRDGFTRPAELAGELEAAAGPFVEWSESYDRLQGWIDDATQLEIYRDHLEWMARATRHLLRTRPWRLFMTQVHVLDMAYHLYWGAIDPRHPGYRAELAPRYWELLCDVHRMVDDLVAAVLAELDDETLFVVMGEHGHDLYHTGLLTNHLLIRQGLLALRRDPRTGRPVVDWSRTRAYASSYRIYLNVRGRDPGGLIEPGDREQVRDQVIAALYAVRDPRTGDAPVRLALAREDAGGLGLYGPSMGDVIFAMAPGFQARGSIEPPPECWIGSRLVAARVPLLAPTELFVDFTGDHDTALPFTQSIHTLLYLHGRGVRPNQGQVPVRLVDVAPTMCQWLGLPPPASSEGSIIWQAFR